jgi:hypothetical protein
MSYKTDPKKTNYAEKEGKITIKKVKTGLILTLTGKAW